ncbi:MAG: bifunctional UDP-sugar hydrolase/5'-nucleotidase [Myxococcales bacterium]|nr:CapA family protein [Myxococcales bacterium]
MRRLVLLGTLALACSGSPAPKKLVILHTNDEHSHLIGLGPEIDDFPTPAPSGTGIKGGASRRSVVLKTERDAAKAAGADTLTVSAGDNMMGSLMQIAATTVSADYRVMKLLGYDVTTLGNHEFDYGPAGLALIIGAAQATPEKLPVIVASNIHFAGTSDAPLQAMYDANNTDPAKPIHGKFVITTPNGIKVGFIGIMGADAQAVAPAAAPTTFSLPPGTTTDNRLASLAQIFDDVQPFVDSLRRDDKVDLVVALSHSGADLSNEAKSEDIAIAQNVSGIDVIVSGHSHSDFPAQLYTNAHTGKQVLVQQAGRFGDQVGRISLTVNSDRTVSFDKDNSILIPVTDKKAPSDPAVDALVDGTVDALESTNIPGQQLSFMRYTILETTGAAPAATPSKRGDYYNYPVAALPFDVDNSAKFQETELLDLITDSELAAANHVAPTDLAAEGYGATRVPALRKGLTGVLGFADLFAAVPLGGSPASGTPGYPLCRFGIYLAEVKAAFEVTAGFAYTGHDDLFLVPAGFRFKYDTTRNPYNPSGDATSKDNGRVVKIDALIPTALASGNYDGDANYVTVFDASKTAADSLPGNPGWLPTIYDRPNDIPPFFYGSPTRLVKVAVSYYIATFATFAGIKLKALNDTMPTLADGAPVPGNDATRTILKRSALEGGTEIKEWEALAAWVHAHGTMPARYNSADPAGAIPRRAICIGAHSTNATGGNCSQ